MDNAEGSGFVNPWAARYLLKDKETISLKTGMIHIFQDLYLSYSMLASMRFLSNLATGFRIILGLRKRGSNTFVSVGSCMD